MSTSLLTRLVENGEIWADAKRACRPLTRMERKIVEVVRKEATRAGYSGRFIYASQLEGESCSGRRRPPFVKIRFAYYEDPVPEYDVPARPTYVIVKSNVAGLPTGLNVEADDLAEYGLGVPECPTYEKWVAAGRPCLRWSKKGAFQKFFERIIPALKELLP
jgi:hypothetical protein